MPSTLRVLLRSIVSVTKGVWLIYLSVLITTLNNAHYAKYSIYLFLSKYFLLTGCRWNNWKGSEVVRVNDVSIYLSYNREEKILRGYAKRYKLYDT